MLKILKTTLLVIIIFLNLGCANILYNQDAITETFNNIDEIAEVMRSIEYVADVKENWQLPETTYDRGAGDCEDQASLFAYLIITYLHAENVYLVRCEKSNGEGHMIVEWEGVEWEGIKGVKIKDFDSKYTFTYRMSLATYIILATIM
jgi:hypothetical protein